MSLTSVGKLLNKVVRILNGKEKCGINQFLTAVSLNNAFHMLLELLFVGVFFLPLYNTYTYIKAISQESKPRNSSDYKKNSKTTYHPLPVLHLNWSISLRTVDFTEF